MFAAPMEVSRKVLRRAAELADAGQPFALCTVMTARGSVPGKAGAKMIVERDGSFFGTVGGAGLEEKTKALGLQCLARDASRPPTSSIWPTSDPAPWIVSAAVRWRSWSNTWARSPTSSSAAAVTSGWKWPGCATSSSTSIRWSTTAPSSPGRERFPSAPAATSRPGPRSSSPTADLGGVLPHHHPRLLAPGGHGHPLPLLQAGPGQHLRRVHLQQAQAQGDVRPGARARGDRGGAGPGGGPAGRGHRRRDARPRLRFRSWVASSPTTKAFREH